MAGEVCEEGLGEGGDVMRVEMEDGELKKKKSGMSEIEKGDAGMEV